MRGETGGIEIGDEIGEHGGVGKNGFEGVRGGVGKNSRDGQVQPGEYHAGRVGMRIIRCRRHVGGMVMRAGGWRRR